MDLKFIKRYRPQYSEGKHCFLSEPRVRFDFEIIYNDNENIEVFEKEFKLNCKNQISEIF